jgi:hypothetical protein
MPLAKRRSETSRISFLRAPEGRIAWTLLLRARRHRLSLTAVHFTP